MIGNRDEVFEFLANQDPEQTWEIKEYKVPRTKLANRYYQRLCGLIARKLKSTRTEVHNYLLSEYGEVDNEMPPIGLNADIDWTKMTNMHLVPSGETFYANGEIYAKYYHAVPSHELGSSAFAALVDGAIEQARLVGVSESEILTPNQIAELIALMGKRPDEVCAD